LTEVVDTFNTHGISSSSALSDERGSLMQCETVRKELASLLKLDENVPIGAIIGELRTASRLLHNRIRDLDEGAAKSDLLVQKLEEIAKLESEISQFRSKVNKASSLLTQLEDIAAKLDKKQVLSDFVNSNRQQICDHFISIHSPREFRDIRFESLGSEGIRFIRTSGKESSLSEISTGQRAAFTLAIFLTLNGLVKDGPPYLLLDDPVATVDDLNALAFFDALREVSIASDKQVFFATANDRVATLFARKFSFLGDNFKHVNTPFKRRPVSEHG
jgi:DNA repair exonuclease SbcCD ATPase subunit